MKKALITLALGFGCLLCHGQQMKQRLIVTDGIDSDLQRAFRACFDTLGHYYFETMTDPHMESYTVITNDSRYAPLYWGYDLAFNKYYSATVNGFYADKSKKTIYYKNQRGTKVYGPARGKIRRFWEGDREQIAIELCVADTSFLYINNTLVNVCDTAQQLWDCSFNATGDALYSFYKNGLFRVYLNGKAIDSAFEPITDLSLNDRQYYTYVKSRFNSYTICTPNNAFGPYKGTVGMNELFSDNNYYFISCYDSAYRIITNKGSHANIISPYYEDVDPVTGKTGHRNTELIMAQNNHRDLLFTYTQRSADSGIYFSIGADQYRFPYIATSFCFTDKNSRFAFFGTQTDTYGGEQLYMNINGKQQSMLRRPGYTTQGVQVTPDGHSLYYLEGQDSEIIYQDGKQMYPAISAKQFERWDEAVLPQNHRDGSEFFQGLNIDTFTLITYNNTVSVRLPRVNLNFNRLAPYQPGNIVAGDINENGFFIVEYVAPGKYLLDINNSFYATISDVDRIFGGQSYLCAHELIFYGTKGSGFYEFCMPYRP